MAHFKMVLLGLAVAAAIHMVAPGAHARTVCSDMDGDGVKETCVEIDEDGASLPGEDPPEVPPVGPSGPTGWCTDADGNNFRC